MADFFLLCLIGTWRRYSLNKVFVWSKRWLHNDSFLGICFSPPSPTNKTHLPLRSLLRPRPVCSFSLDINAVSSSWPLLGLVPRPPAQPPCWGFLSCTLSSHGKGEAEQHIFINHEKEWFLCILNRQSRTIISSPEHSLSLDLVVDFWFLSPNEHTNQSANTGSGSDDGSTNENLLKLGFASRDKSKTQQKNEQLYISRAPSYSLRQTVWDRFALNITPFCSPTSVLPTCYDI